MTDVRERLAEPLSVAIKRLSAVEAARDRSHQHEFNGTEPLRQVLGSEARRNWPAQWVFLDDRHDPRLEVHLCSWYDARAEHPTRSEWRLYFQGEPEFFEDDLLVVINRARASNLLLIIARAGSSAWVQLRGALGTGAGPAGGFSAITLEDLDPVYADVFADVLEFAGWMAYPLLSEPADLQRLRDRFPDGFPSTRDFSAYARECVEGAWELGADERLWVWYRREERLFRALEHQELQERLARRPAFEAVEDFLEFSLSIQNRRKSRAGLALENHFEALLAGEEIRFSRGKATEGSRRPDFILPSISAYHDGSFPSRLLTMVGVKTTCKDQWRQILSEAARLPRKHLLTLEPGISRTQLGEMGEAGLVIVAPRPILATYDVPVGLEVRSVHEALGEFKSLQRESNRL